MKSVHSIHPHWTKEWQSKDLLRLLRSISSSNQRLDNERGQILNTIQYFQKTIEHANRTIATLETELANVNAQYSAGTDRYLEARHNFDNASH